MFQIFHLILLIFFILFVSLPLFLFFFLFLKWQYHWKNSLKGYKDVLKNLKFHFNLQLPILFYFPNSNIRVIRKSHNLHKSVILLIFLLCLSGSFYPLYLWLINFGIIRESTCLGIGTLRNFRHLLHYQLISIYLFIY